MPATDTPITSGVLAGFKLAALNEELNKSRLESQYLEEDRGHTLRMQAIREALGQSELSLNEVQKMGAELVRQKNAQDLAQGAEKFPFEIGEIKARTESSKAQTGLTRAQTKQTKARTKGLAAETAQTKALTKESESRTAGNLLENTKNQALIAGLLGQNLGEGGSDLTPEEVMGAATSFIQSIGAPDTPVTQFIFGKTIQGQAQKTRREIEERKEINKSLIAQRQERDRLTFRDVLSPDQVEELRKIGEYLADLQGPVSAALEKQKLGVKLTADEKKQLTRYEGFRTRAKEISDEAMKLLGGGPPVSQKSPADWVAEVKADPKFKNASPIQIADEARRRAGAK